MLAAEENCEKQRKQPKLKIDINIEEMITS